MLGRLIAIEDVGIAGSQHVVDEDKKLFEVELDGVLEQLPVVHFDEAQGTLTRVGYLLCLGLLVASFLLFIVLCVAISCHGICETYDLFLQVQILLLESKIDMHLKYLVLLYLFAHLHYVFLRQQELKE